MNLLGSTIYRITPIALTVLLATACVPVKLGSGGNSKTNAPNAFAIKTLVVGSPPVAIQAVGGNYYSKFAPMTINGTCSGAVSQISIQVTPGTSSTVPCSGGTFLAPQNLTVENTYAIVLTPQDSGGSAVSGLTPISTNYRYDTTAPVAPAFVSPTFSHNYTITDGSTSVTIAGQVNADVSKLIGPFSINIPLVPDVDGIHQDFVYNATVPVSTTSDFTFTAFDLATNSSSSTMSIVSQLNLSIPITANPSGGSHVVNSNVTIDSSVSAISGVTVDQNVTNAVGHAGILGNM